MNMKYIDWYDKRIKSVKSNEWNTHQAKEPYSGAK